MFLERSTRQFSHLCGPLKLVWACLCAGKELENCFNRCGDSVKHVYECLCAGKEREICFHPPMKLV